jgi:hypothetical protein
MERGCFFMLLKKEPHPAQWVVLKLIHQVHILFPQVPEPAEGT